MSKRDRRQHKKLHRRQKRIRQEKHIRRTDGRYGSTAGHRPASRPSASTNRRPDFTSERIQRLLAKLLAEHPDRDPQELAESLLGQRWRAPYQAWLAADPHERAQDLAFQAMEAKHPSQRRRFVSQALEVDLHCLDAVNLQWQAADETDTCESLNPAHDLLDAVHQVEQRPGIADLLRNVARQAGDHVILRPYLRGLRSLVDMRLDGDDYPAAAALARRLMALDGKRDFGHAEHLLGILLSQGDLAAAQVILDTEIPNDAVIQPWGRACFSFLAGDRSAARIQIDRGRSESPEFEEALMGEFSHPWSETYDALMTIADHQVDLRIWVEDGCPTTTPEEREAAVASYADPVAQLIDLDEPSCELREHMAQLAGLGFTAVHIPELLRLANDQAIHECLDEDPASWAPLHAVVALGRMGDLVPEDALMAVVQRRLHDAVLDLDLRAAVIARGAGVLPTLRRWLNDEQRLRDERVWAGETMVDVARALPDARSGIVADFMSVLRRFAQHGGIFNAELVGFLAALGAVEAEGLVQEAYAASAVDVEYGDDFAHWVNWAKTESAS